MVHKRDFVNGRELCRNIRVGNEWILQITGWNCSRFIPGEYTPGRTELFDEIQRISLQEYGEWQQDDRTDVGEQRDAAGETDRHHRQGSGYQIDDESHEQIANERPCVAGQQR